MPSLRKKSAEIAGIETSCGFAPAETPWTCHLNATRLRFLTHDDRISAMSNRDEAGAITEHRWGPKRESASGAGVRLVFPVPSHDRCFVHRVEQRTKLLIIVFARFLKRIVTGRIGNPAAKGEAHVVSALNHRDQRGARPVGPPGIEASAIAATRAASAEVRAASAIAATHVIRAKLDPEWNTNDTAVCCYVRWRFYQWPNTH